VTIYFLCATQSGPDVTEEETWGVNYRSLNDLFEISQTRADSITYDVKVQMIEIYNEQVRDLLMADGANRRYPFMMNKLYLFLNTEVEISPPLTFFALLSKVCFSCMPLLYFFNHETH